MPMPFCRRGNPYTIKSSAKARRCSLCMAICAPAHISHPFFLTCQRGSPVIFLTCAEQEKAATIRRFIALMTFQRTCMRYCGI